MTKLNPIKILMDARQACIMESKDPWDTHADAGIVLLMAAFHLERKVCPVMRQGQTSMQLLWKQSSS